MEKEIRHLKETLGQKGIDPESSKPMDPPKIKRVSSQP
jgi:hypothetical protein